MITLVRMPQCQQHFIRIIALILTFLCISKLWAKPPTLSPDGTFALNGVSPQETTHFFRLLSDYEKQFYLISGYIPIAAPPVVIVLHDENELLSGFLGVPSLRMDAAEGGLPKIQIDLSLDASTKASTGLFLAKSMLLRQYYNGKSPPPGGHIADFPAWVLHGLGRLCNSEAKSIVIPSSYLRGDTPPSIPDLLIQKAPDESNLVLLEIYETMSAELLRAGLNSQNGANAFRDWIGVFDPNAPYHSASRWPSGWSMQSVERRWLLLLASKSQKDSNIVKRLSINETLSRYREIRAQVITPDHSLLGLKKEKGSDYLVMQNSSRLIALRLQANPIADELLDKSILLCANFKHLSAKKIKKKEQELTILLEETIKRSHSIESYLDWFEASKLPVVSGLFENTIKSTSSPVQKGPIGRYLDTIETRGW